MKRSDFASSFNGCQDDCGRGGNGNGGGGGTVGGPTGGNCDGREGGGGGGCEEQKPNGQMTGGTASRQKATSIAQKAAKEAKEAEDAQLGAGVAASHAIKEQLAERAHQAAVAAEAALAGKKQIVDELQHEVHEAEGVVQEEYSSMQSAETVVQAAIQAHQEATRILKLLTEALAISQTNVGNAETAAQGAQSELSEKTALVDAAKNRVELLLRQLCVARADLANTKQAENVAEHAAHSAKQNADRVRRTLFRD